MTLRNLFLPLSLVAAFATALPSAAASSSYDDEEDDIYYNPSKSAPAKKQQQPATTVARDSYVPNRVYDYPAADTYTPSGAGLDVDVDTYNRRGKDAVPDSISLDRLEALSGNAADTYTYTRRIEQYYNPDVVNASGDQDLIDSYYSQPSTDVNLYVVNTVPGYYPYYNWGWYSPWYGPSWSVSWYNPWYDWAWGWGPSWGPAWGPSWGPAWGPGWNPGPPPPPGRPSYNWNTPGASRPHGPASGSGGGGSTASRRPGAFSAGATNAARPGNLGRPGSMGQSTTSQRRPGVAPSYNGSSTSRPASGSGVKVTNPRGRGYQQGTQQQQQTTRPSYNNTPSRSSYNSGSSRGSGSWGGSSRSGSGGGTHGRGRGR